MAYIPPHKRGNALGNPKKFHTSNTTVNCSRNVKKNKPQTVKGKDPSVDTKKRKAGIIPCQTINDRRYILLQISYSSYEYDFKIDPFRGESNSGETEVSTAIRETKEESAQLLQFREEDLKNVKIIRNGRYPYPKFFVHTKFGDGSFETAQQLRQLYARNVPLLDEEDTHNLETESVYWLDIDTVDDTSEKAFPRISSEVKEIVRRLANTWDEIISLPAVQLHRAQENNLHFYSSTVQEANQMDDLAILMEMVALDELEIILRDTEWRRRRHQIAKYGDDKQEMINTLLREKNIPEETILMEMSDETIREENPNYAPP